jgi:hypothetical protein
MLWWIMGYLALSGAFGLMIGRMIHFGMGDDDDVDHDGED